MISEFKRRDRFLKNGSTIKSDMYELLMQNTLNNYNKYNVTKVLEHSMELDKDNSESMLKAIDFYVENLIKQPKETKRNEHFILEYISKIRDIEQFRNSLRRRRSIYKNKVHKTEGIIKKHKDNLSKLNNIDKLNDTSEIVEEFYNKILECVNNICFCDRIRKNYEIILRRFNIDKMIKNQAISNESSKKCVNEICKFIETYNFTAKQKLKLTIEISFYGLSVNGCRFDFKSILEEIILFFKFNESISKQEIKDVLNEIGKNLDAFNNLNIDRFVSSLIFELDNDDKIYGMTLNEKYEFIVNKFAELKNYSPDLYLKFINSIFDTCGVLILKRNFSKLIKLIELISWNSDYLKEEFYYKIFEFLKNKTNILNNEKIHLIDIALQTIIIYQDNFVETLCFKLKLLKKDINESINKSSQTNEICEAAFLGKVNAVIDKFKSSLTSLSDKEKMASDTFDAAIESIKKSLSESEDKEAREDVIADRFIPRASRVVKLTLTLGLAYMVSPTLSVIGLFLFLAKTYAKRSEERRKILNELDVEIDMCKKYIKKADDKEDFEKVKRNKLILKKLSDTREQIKSLMASKGENIYASDTKSDDD